MRRQPPPQSDRRRLVDQDFQRLISSSQKVILESKAAIEQSRDLMAKLERLTSPEQKAAIEQSRDLMARLDRLTTPEHKDSSGPPTRTR